MQIHRSLNMFGEVWTMFLCTLARWFIIRVLAIDEVCLVHGSFRCRGSHVVVRPCEFVFRTILGYCEVTSVCGGGHDNRWIWCWTCLEIFMDMRFPSSRQECPCSSFRRPPLPNPISYLRCRIYSPLLLFPRILWPRYTEHIMILSYSKFSNRWHASKYFGVNISYIDEHLRGNKYIRKSAFPIWKL